MTKDTPFLFGTQYYRAPTPEKECWERDLKHMKDLGFNCVKFWAQWRWTHREEDTFYFDDLDELMDIAYKNGLAVTINVIFDVAPTWLYKKYPDAYQQLRSGEKVLPMVVGHRQIGGFPGPCYNHDGALYQRKRFMEAVINRYKDHPAMSMWDVWNEPEQCGCYRRPEDHTLTCFCPTCKQKFVLWLKGKYQTIDKLNEVWGRCYCDWDEVELPANGMTFIDFIDFREFHLDTMTDEANWRLRMVKELDSKHIAYLHVVPNTMKVFNSATGVDDFAMAKECDVFAATLFAGPMWGTLATSAANGKVCYNVECHIGNGSTKMHPKIITLHDMLKDFLPQIGMGIKGFMFWQFRPEILGLESPAWGMLKLNGDDGSISLAAKEFWENIRPLTDELLQGRADKAQIAVWNSRKNELFNYALFSDMDALSDNTESYIKHLYWNNYDCRFINADMLENGMLDDIKLIIMPSCYCITQKEADALDRFVQGGGVLLCEAHLGGYNATTGRHSRVVPGCGLQEKWGIKEIETTSSYHLESSENVAVDKSGMVDDVKKAVEAYGVKGSKYFPIDYNGTVVMGAERFAVLEGEDAEVLGSFNGKACIISKNVGKGTVVYCGSNLGEGALSGGDFGMLVDKVCSIAGVKPKHIGTDEGVRIDEMASLLIINNNASSAKNIVIDRDGTYKGVFTGEIISGHTQHTIPAEFVDIFKRV